MKIPKRSLVLSLILVFAIVVISYSQYLKEGLISAVLQYQIDLNNPPNFIYAVSTSNQILPDGKQLPKGTRFIGMLAKEEKGIVIYFDTVQSLSGKKNPIIAKSFLSSKASDRIEGVSAKIGKTLYKQTKSNVLGAIFTKGVSKAEDFSASILPQGSHLKIEVN